LNRLGGAELSEIRGGCQSQKRRKIGIWHPSGRIFERLRPGSTADRQNCRNALQNRQFMLRRKSESSRRQKRAAEPLVPPLSW
jgi:hypothetical protein